MPSKTIALQDHCLERHPTQLRRLHQNACGPAAALAQSNVSLASSHLTQLQLHLKPWRTAPNPRLTHPTGAASGCWQRATATAAAAATASAAAVRAEKSQADTHQVCPESLLVLAGCLASCLLICLQQCRRGKHQAVVIKCRGKNKHWCFLCCMHPPDQQPAWCRGCHQGWVHCVFATRRVA